MRTTIYRSLFLVIILFLTTSNIVNAQEFITTWQTTVDNETITIPTNGSGYSFTINWGDGSIESNQAGSVSHNYAFAGTQTISISGDFPRIYFNNSGDRTKILTIEAWGNIEWTSMANAFYGCTNLNITNSSIDTPDLSGVTSMQRMFRGCTSFDADIDNWDTSEITSMLETFTNCSIFNKSIDSWDVIKVTAMQNMFLNASQFNQDLNSWDVDFVTSMAGMFTGATSFNGNISDWDVNRVTNMSNMFNSATSFTQDLNDWDVDLVTSMSGMFSRATSFNGNISGWNVSSVTNMTSMFNDCFLFNQDISGWIVSNVTNMTSMFTDCLLFDQDISGWNVSSVTNMTSMFFGATTFNQDIGSWNVSNVTSMSSMFRDASSFDQNLGGWDVSGATNLSNMFLSITLSVPNYDALLKGWSLLSLQSGEAFHAGNSEYCTAATERQKIIDDFGWNISDGGVTTTVIDAIDDVNKAGSYELPTPTGINITNQEKYYTEPNGNGTEYSIGDIIQFSDFGSYPISLYVRGECTNVEASFSLTLTDATPFITTWLTTSDNETITIPTTGGGYDYTVNWGDDSVETNQTGSVTHTYQNAGTQTVSITGDFPRIHFNSGGEKLKIQTIEQWGDIVWSSMENAFDGCTNLEITNTEIDSPNLLGVISTQNMFRNAASFDTDISDWDVSNITNMTDMLSGVTLSTVNYDALLKD